MGCNQVDNIIQDIASFINELLDIETKKTSFDVSVISIKLSFALLTLKGVKENTFETLMFVNCEPSPTKELALTVCAFIWFAVMFPFLTISLPLYLIELDSMEFTFISLSPNDNQLTIFWKFVFQALPDNALLI